MIFECVYDKFNYLRLSARIVNEHFGIIQNINFCVDTGAPYSFISFKDATLMGIVFNDLAKNNIVMPIGGNKYDTYNFESSKLLLRSETNELSEIKFSPIFILGPDPPNEKPLPSIIGMNYLSNYTLVVNATRFGRRAYLTDTRVITG